MATEQKIKILAVVGPTASGKTAVSVELAKRLGGEVVSCDSMQVYRRMNIGTAKPTKEETCGIAHHLIDAVEPDAPFSCAEYVTMAGETVKDITARGKLPILCGGTGLYLDRFLSGAEFESTEVDENFRCEMNDFATNFGNEALHQKLREIDPKSADEIHPNNVKRVIRALEIYKTSGKTKSEIDSESKNFESKYNCIQIGIKYENREVLYNKINLRVDKMIQAGWDPFLATVAKREYSVITGDFDVYHHTITIVTSPTDSISWTLDVDNIKDDSIFNEANWVKEVSNEGYPTYHSWYYTIE